MWNHLGRKRPSVSVHVLCPLFLSAELWAVSHAWPHDVSITWLRDGHAACHTHSYTTCCLCLLQATHFIVTLFWLVAARAMRRNWIQEVFYSCTYTKVCSPAYLLLFKESSTGRFALVILWGRMGCIPIVVCFNYLKLTARRKWAINVDLKGKKWVYLMWISVYSRTVQSSSLTRVQ